jgi:hypothetical protein
MIFMKFNFYKYIIKQNSMFKYFFHDKQFYNDRVTFSWSDLFLLLKYVTIFGKIKYV